MFGQVAVAADDAEVGVGELRLEVGQLRAAGAVAAGGTLLIVGHDLENLTAGHGGPHDPSVLYRPADIAADIAAQQMIIVRAETAIRSLTDSQGRPAQALDALVVARRALT